MKIVDEKGKLFGKVNLIDLLLIVLVVAAIAFAAVKLTDTAAVSSSGQTFEMSFYTEEVSDFVAEKIKVGDVLMDADRNVDLGKVTEVILEPSVSWAADNNGNYVKTSRDGYYSVTIKGELTGATRYENGIIAGATRYGVGHSMTLRAGDAKIYLRVSDIVAKEQ